ncbi:protein NCBP2AS2 [Carcharodon carcharias]|uniref:protein NCBP2AS2 n=1 Tax=Carcharodon carcharias TaxID=13397 RepID=UPI001B7EAA01|nr:protein NCBP2AS2 [Carcharodon carcharias]
MVLGKLLQSVLNNARLIEKLSETPPIRRAAQITVYLISRLELGGRNAAQRLSQSSTVRQLRERTNIPRNLGELSKRAAQLRDTWAKELREGMKGTSGQKKQK